MKNDELRYGDDVLGGASEVERRRLVAIAETNDPTTRALLRSLGLTAGWTCWEVGAGAGTVATWLADQVVADGGSVLATDIDDAALAMASAAPQPGLSVQRHDVVHDPLPDTRFHLIHARFVLEHLREREDVLDRLVSALAPNGIIVIESVAHGFIESSPHAPLREAMSGLEQVMAATIGTDCSWARNFPACFLARGLTDLGAQARISSTGGRNASATCWALTLQRLRPRILEQGLSSAEALDAADQLLSDPMFFDFVFSSIAGWGRRKGLREKTG
ncbi:class I SAM-dependent methyltransferase [Pseudonocardia xinjiangensis]|uniref:class I SAM-dependent methyltransferase n=1 Tax=Pseudonocardia xinjiangensis TaxID=75289 RepID=UPI003D89C26B